MSWFQRKRTREAGARRLLPAPSLAIFFLYRILPLGWNVLLSFQAWSPLKAAHFIGLEHYEEMLLDDDVFWQALGQHADLHRLLADRHRRWRSASRCWSTATSGAPRIYRTIVFLSYPLMTVAVGIIWRWLYDERGGFINYVAALERARSTSRSSSCKASTGRCPA